MRTLLIFAAISLTACSAPRTETTSPALKAYPDITTMVLPNNPEAAAMTQKYLSVMDSKMDLAARIGYIETRDQYVREVFIDMFSDPTLDSDVRSQFQKAGGAYVEAIDEINTRELKDIMKDTTWRNLAMHEDRLASRAFHIVQHTNDDTYREAVLSEIKPLAEEGLMEGQLYALMYDRVQLKAGRMQRYGTQMKCVNGQHDVHSLENPEGVEARRAALDMEPLTSYIKTSREYYGPCKSED